MGISTLAETLRKVGRALRATNVDEIAARQAQETQAQEALLAEQARQQQELSRRISSAIASFNSPYRELIIYTDANGPRAEIGAVMLQNQSKVASLREKRAELVRGTHTDGEIWNIDGEIRRLSHFDSKVPDTPYFMHLADASVACRELVTLAKANPSHAVVIGDEVNKLYTLLVADRETVVMAQSVFDSLAMVSAPVMSGSIALSPERRAMLELKLQDYEEFYRTAQCLRQHWLKRNVVQYRKGEFSAYSPWSAGSRMERAFDSATSARRDLRSKIDALAAEYAETHGKLVTEISASLSDLPERCKSLVKEADGVYSLMQKYEASPLEGLTEICRRAGRSLDYGPLARMQPSESHNEFVTAARRIVKPIAESWNMAQINVKAWNDSYTAGRTALQADASKKASQGDFLGTDAEQLSSVLSAEHDAMVSFYTSIHATVRNLETTIVTNAKCLATSLQQGDYAAAERSFGALCVASGIYEFNLSGLRQSPLLAASGIDLAPHEAFSAEIGKVISYVSGAINVYATMEDVLPSEAVQYNAVSSERTLTLDSLSAQAQRIASALTKRADENATRAQQRVVVERDLGRLTPEYLGGTGATGIFNLHGEVRIDAPVLEAIASHYRQKISALDEAQRKADEAAIETAKAEISRFVDVALESARALAGDVSDARQAKKAAASIDSLLTTLRGDNLQQLSKGDARYAEIGRLLVGIKDKARVLEEVTKDFEEAQAAYVRLTGIRNALALDNYSGALALARKGDLATDMLAADTDRVASHTARVALLNRFNSLDFKTAGADVLEAYNAATRHTPDKLKVYLAKGFRFALEPQVQEAVAVLESYEQINELAGLLTAVGIQVKPIKLTKPQEERAVYVLAACKAYLRSGIDADTINKWNCTLARAEYCAQNWEWNRCAEYVLGLEHLKESFSGSSTPRDPMFSNLPMPTIGTADALKLSGLITSLNRRNEWWRSDYGARIADTMPYR